MEKKPTQHEKILNFMQKNGGITCEKMSKRMKEDWKDINSKYNSEDMKQKQSNNMSLLQSQNKLRNSYSRGHQGKRKDLNNKYFRSSWEANYARYLNFLIKQKQIYKWEYEPDTYYFEQIKRGTRSYTPDFKIWEKLNSEPYYVEVKGWMDDKSRVKLQRMAKYYPQIKVELFDKDNYKDLKNKLSRIIDNWE